MNIEFIKTFVIVFVMAFVYINVIKRYGQLLLSTAILGVAHWLLYNSGMELEKGGLMFGLFLAIVYIVYVLK